MADHLKPTNTSAYTNYTSEIMGRVDDSLKMLDPATTTPTNIPTNSVRWNSASGLWEKWSGTAWGALTSVYNIVALKAKNLVGGNNTTLLGSIPYQSNTDTTTLLAPNTTTTRKFLRQTGTGTNGAAPVWDTILASDIPILNQNTTGNAATATTASSCTGNSATATTANSLNTSNSYTGFGFTANGGAFRTQNWGSVPTDGVVYFGNADSFIFKSGGGWSFNNQQGFNNVLNTNGNIVTANGGTWSINATTATTAANADKLIGKNWYWSGQGGQPTWLWGGSDGTNMYVYNPANFVVYQASSLTNHQWASHGGSGYIRLSTGLIIQWGVFNNTASSVAITFPLAFPSACVNVIASTYYPGDTGGLNTITSGTSSLPSTTGVVFTTYSNAGVLTYWTAIGY